MDWITSRIKEPTTWLSVGMGALVFSVLIPKWAIVLVLVANIIFNFIIYNGLLVDHLDFYYVNLLLF